MYKVIVRNWSLKLFALALAVSLWANVVGQETGEVGIKLPVQLSNLPQDLVVKGEVPTEVEMRLYGPSSLVARLANEDRHKELNLSGLKEGLHVFGVGAEDLELPGNVRVIRVSPARLNVILVPRKTKKLPVRPIIKGKPAAGFTMGEVEFEPKEVVASGNEDTLKELDWIWTNPIEVSGLKAGRSQKVPLQLPPDHTLRLSPSEVKANVHILPARDEGTKRKSSPSRVKKEKTQGQETTEVVKEAAQEAAKQAESSEPETGKATDAQGSKQPEAPASSQ